MEKYYIITGSCNEGGSLHIYVKCDEAHIDKIADGCGVGCSECQIVNEIEPVDVEHLEYIEINGTLFMKSMLRL